jgi:hypothetical protein
MTTYMKDTITAHKVHVGMVNPKIFLLFSFRFAILIGELTTY